MKNIVKLCLILLFLFIFAFRAHAKSNYLTTYKVNYTVNQDSLTHVNFNIQLENQTPNFYVSNYNLTVGFKDIQNLKATSTQSTILATSQSASQGSKIFLKFDKRVVGLNKNLTFNVSFDTKDVAHNLDNTWEINIPGTANINEFKNFNVEVDYPINLGKPKFVKPNLKTEATNSGKLVFSKHNLGNTGISIAFGNYQAYGFNLKYHLQNDNVFTITKEIALPPDTGYQTVQISSINPKPLNIISDKDGNWLAQYKLAPMQKIEVLVFGKTKIALTPKQEEINQELKSAYLSAQKYWESDDTTIINIAKTLKNPQDIYKFVLNKLNYDYSRPQNAKRYGAVNSLKNANSAVCLEFTDLFIALARAAGIPAREVDGFAYNSNTLQRPSSLIKDVLHAWPEYYDFDKKMWIMVDPTWGKTTGGLDYFSTLDFDHIAFAIKGVSSSYPIPAGGYKQNTLNTSKDVDVFITGAFIDKKDISINTSSQTVIAGFPISVNFSVTNNGNQSINNEKILVLASNLNPSSQVLLSNTILPFGKQQMIINYKPESFLTNSSDTIKITVDNKVFAAKLTIVPFFSSKNFLLGGIVFVISCILLSAIAYGIWRLPIFRRKR
jgi:transglutaminase-like putative cysteine protease